MTDDQVSIDAVAAEAAAMFELDVRSAVANVIDGRLRKCSPEAARGATHALRGVGYEVFQALQSAGFLRTPEDRLLRNAYERLQQHLEATVREGEERIAAAAMTPEDRAVLDAADAYEAIMAYPQNAVAINLVAAVRARRAAGGTEAPTIVVKESDFQALYNVVLAAGGTVPTDPVAFYGESVDLAGGEKP